jgi:hypothetical protein
MEFANLIFKKWPLSVVECNANEIEIEDGKVNVIAPHAICEAREKMVR